MASVNKAILIGNLGRDPEIRYTPSGQAVASFTIATSEKWRDKDGQMQERTDWHNIVCWGRQAELANQYLKKGRPVYLEGRIQNRSYDDKEGNKKYISEIVVQRLQFLGGRPEDGGAASSGGGTGTHQELPEMPPDTVGEDDDLPF